MDVSNFPPRYRTSLVLGVETEHQDKPLISHTHGYRGYFHGKLEDLLGFDLIVVLSGSIEGIERMHSHRMLVEVKALGYTGPAIGVFWTCFDRLNYDARPLRDREEFRNMESWRMQYVEPSLSRRCLIMHPDDEEAIVYAEKCACDYRSLL